MTTFAQLLSAELSRHAFGTVLASAEDQLVTREAVAHTARLQSALAPYWPDILRSVEPLRTQHDLTRIIGFGSMLTEFSAAFLCGEPKKRDLVQLGALFNLIAALYDYFLDHPLQGETFLLKRETLLQAVRDKDETGLQALAQTGTLRERVIARLILRYLGQLQALTSPQTPIQYVQTFRKLILRMFDAQNATVQNNVIPAHLVMRKSALSIVALGFPVWMSGVTNPACMYFSHLRWMYQVGDFISWVDDFADFEQDRDTGLPNRLLSDPLYPYERAQRVAQLGLKVLKFRENLKVEGENSSEINKLFTKYIYNWLKW